MWRAAAYLAVLIALSDKLRQLVVETWSEDLRHSFKNSEWAERRASRERYRVTQCSVQPSIVLFAKSCRYESDHAGLTVLSDCVQFTLLALVWAVEVLISHVNSN